MIKFPTLLPKISNEIITVMLFFVVSVNAIDNDTKQTTKKIDLENISTKGLDNSVAKVFRQTKDLIVKARNDLDRNTELSASKQWCLLLHNFEFLQQAKDCYFTIGMDSKKEAKWPYLYGKVAQQQGNVEEAIKGFKQAIFRDKNYLPAHYYLIKSALEAGEIALAFELQNKLPITLQLVAIILKTKGDLYYETENYHIAIGYYKQTLNTAPNANRINYQIAQAYQALGQMDKAKEYMALSGESGIKLVDPYFQEVKNTTVGEIPYLIKAKLALTHGDIKLAIKHYKKALKFNPNSESAKVNIAVAYYQNGQIDKAEKQFKNVLKDNPMQLVVLYNLAIISKSQNNNKQAINYFEQYKQLNVTDSSVYVNLAELYYHTKQYDLVLKTANAKSMSSNEAIQILKAKSLGYLQKYSLAIELLNRINDNKPGNREVILMLSKLYSQVPELKLRNPKQSLLYATQANNLKQDKYSMWQLIIALDEVQQCQDLAGKLNELAQILNSAPIEIYKELKIRRTNSLKCIIDES